MQLYGGNMCYCGKVREEKKKKRIIRKNSFL